MTRDHVRGTTNPSTQVAAAFDSVARIFEETLENSITMRLRERVYAVVQSLVSPGSRIIDINCGTGIDALHFAHNGFRVTGIDISPNMIAEATKKIGPSLRESLNFTIGSFDQLSSRTLPLADLLFSNFGGLNCTSDIVRVAREISAATRRGGYFVGVVMSRFSLWEFLAFASRFQWRNATRRLRRDTLAHGFPSGTFQVSYYSPRSVVKAFEPAFHVRRILGLSILSPTPQSTTFVRRHPGITSTLESIDTLLGRLPVLRSIGDHFIIVMQKV